MVSYGPKKGSLLDLIRSHDGPKKASYRSIRCQDGHKKVFYGSYEISTHMDLKRAPMVVSWSHMDLNRLIVFNNASLIMSHLPVPLMS